MSRKRNEKVDLIIGAKDKTAGVLRNIKSQVIGIGAAYVGWQAVTGILGSISDKGKEHEKVWGDVSAALGRHGHVVDSNLKKIQSFADEMQTLTGESDEFVGKSVQGFLDYGQSVEQAMDTTRVALDLAAGSGMNLKSATDLLSKAAVGYTSTLSRYGIIIDENIPKSEKFAEAIDQITARFGGAAASRADYYATRVSLLDERFGDLQERLFNGVQPVFGGVVELGIDMVGMLDSVAEAIGLIEPTEEINDLETDFENTAIAVEKLNTAFIEGKVSLEEYQMQIAGIAEGAFLDTQRTVTQVIEELRKSGRTYLEAQQDLFGFFEKGEINLDGLIDAQNELAALAKAAQDHGEIITRTTIKYDFLIEDIDPDNVADVLQSMRDLIKQGVVFGSKEELKDYFINALGYAPELFAEAVEDPLKEGLKVAMENISNYIDASEFQSIPSISLEAIIDEDEITQATQDRMQAIFAATEAGNQELDELYAQSYEVRLDLATDFDADLMRIETKRKKRIAKVQSTELLSEKQKTDKITAINEVAAKQVADTHEKYSKQTAKRAGELAGTIMNEFVNLSGDMDKLWTQMAKHFGNYFLEEILMMIFPGSKFMKSFLGAFKFWDVPENDRAAEREGERFVMMLERGMDRALQTMSPPRIPITHNAIGSRSGASSQQIVIINQGGERTIDLDYIRNELLPAIESESYEGLGEIVVDKNNLTGNYEVATA